MSEAANASTLAYGKHDLDALVEVDPARFHRVKVLADAGLQVLHVTLAPGQHMPHHSHPGRQVLLHGLAGVTTLDLGSETIDLHANHLVYLSGEQTVSPRNDSSEPCAMLITLVRKV